MAEPSGSSLTAIVVAAAAVAAFVLLWLRFLRLMRLRRTMLRIYALSEEVFRTRDAAGMLKVLRDGFPVGLGLYPEAIVAGSEERGEDFCSIPMVVEGQRYGSLVCRRMGRAKPLRAEMEALENLANQVGAALKRLEDKGTTERRQTSSDR